jgi:hypothetical protein
MAARAEAILWAILERCGRSPEGYPMDAGHAIVALLIRHGLLVTRADYRVALTDKGRDVLDQLPLLMGEPERAKIRRKNQKKRWSVRLRSGQRMLPWPAPKGRGK